MFIIIMMINKGDNDDDNNDVNDVYTIITNFCFFFGQKTNQKTTTSISQINMIFS